MSAEAERALVGIVIQASKPDLYKSSGLTGADFTDPLCRELWELAGQLIASGLRPDSSTLVTAKPDLATSAREITELEDTGRVVRSNAAFYVAKITEASMERAARAVLADAKSDLAEKGPAALAGIVDRLAKVSERARPRGDGTAGFRLVNVGALEIRQPSWLVRDFLEANSLALLFGDPAAGKSFVALDLAACVATGCPFHGRRIARRGPVVYIAGEGHNGLARRLGAWSIARGVSLAEAPLLISTLPAALCDPASMATVEAAVTKAAESFGSIAIIVFDTWSRNLAGDENSSVDTALAIAALDRLRAPWGAAGLVVHHVGHGEKVRARGSTVLRGAVDLELRVERGADTFVRIICTKAKDIAPPPPMAFRLEDVDLGIVDEDGRPVVSAVLEEETWRAEEAPRAPSGKNQKLALEILSTEIERHRINVKASGRDPSEAGVSVDAWRDACGSAGVDRRRFSDVKLALQDAAAITIEGNFVTLFQPPAVVRFPPPYKGRKTGGQNTGQEPDAIRTKTGQEPDNDAGDIF